MPPYVQASCFNTLRQTVDFPEPGTPVMAMQKWVYEKKQEKTAQEGLKLLELKFNFGKRLYRDRDELHER